MSMKDSKLTLWIVTESEKQQKQLARFKDILAKFQLFIINLQCRFY